MKLTKKVLALVMAVIMLASVFAFSASALTYSPSMTTGELGVIMSADKTEVKPGDTVTFSVMIDKGSYSDFGPWMTTIVYSSSHLAPVSTTNTTFRQYTNECANFMKQTSTVNFNYPIAQLTALTTDEKAYYDKAIMMNGVVDTSVTTNAAGNGWTPADANTAQVTFQMVVADGLAAGTEIWIGNHEATYTKGVSYMSPAGGTRYANTVYNLTDSMLKLTVEAEKSPVYKKSSQIRYNSAETNGEGSANFDVRTRAAMTAADFAKYCTYNAETKETNITKVGFVYADSSVGLTLDNAAKVIGGTAVAGYVDVPVEHIQLKDGEYIWTCLITDADYNDAVDSVGYIVAGGKTFYFDAVSATDFSELYDTWSSKIPA